jgi:putative tricarboxylic transport membrane protein
MKRALRSVGFGRRILISFAAAAFAASLGPTAAYADDYPSRPVTFVVGFGVGGSADRTARALAQFLPAELGQPVTVVNREGAGGQLAATYVLSQPADGYTLLATAISPYLANSIIHTGATYTLDDFAFINGQWSDWDVIALNKDREFQTLAEFMKSVQANPRQHSASVVTGSAGELTAYLLMEAAGLPNDALNVVTYESGGAARAAVAGGQVDITIVGGEGTEGIREMIRPLAVVRDDSAEGWDAPPVNEALGEAGMEIPVVNGSIRGLAASAEFRDSQPEAWKKLVSAYERTMQNPEFIAFLKQNDIGADWLGPEKTAEIVKRNYEILERYKDKIEK